MTEQGKLKQLSSKRIANAYPACQLSYAGCGFCAALFQTNLGLRCSIADWRDCCTGQTHGHGCPASDGPERMSAVSKLSSGLESRGLVQFADWARVAQVVGDDFCAEGAVGRGAR